MTNNTCKTCGAVLLAAIIFVEAGPSFGCEHCHTPPHIPENGGFSYDQAMAVPSISASGFTTSAVIGLTHE